MPKSPKCLKPMTLCTRRFAPPSKCYPRPAHPFIRPSSASAYRSEHSWPQTHPLRRHMEVRYMFYLNIPIIPKTVFFNLLRNHGTGLKKFSSTWTCQKMTIWGTPKYQNPDKRHIIQCLVALQLGITALKGSLF